MGLSNTIVVEQAALTPVVLHWPPTMCLNDDRFYEFCRANRELRIERSA